MASFNRHIAFPVPTGGYRPDLHPTKVPPDALAAASNVIVREGVLRQRPRVAPFPADLAERVVALAQWQADTEAGCLVAMTTRGWWHYDFAGETWEDISGTGVGEANEGKALRGSSWALGSFRTFDSLGKTWLIGCNGVDPPWCWDGEADVVTILDGELATDTEAAKPAAPAGVVPIVSARRLVLAGFDEDGIAIDVSAFNDFTRGWGEVQQTLLGDTPGRIIAGMEVNANQHTIYKTDAIHRGIAQVEFYGVAAPFRYETVALNVPGPVSPRAIVRMPDGTDVYLGQDGDLHIFDGVRPIPLSQALGHTAIRDHVQATWGFNDRRTSWMVYDHERGILWVFYPDTSGYQHTGIMVDTSNGWTMWPFVFGGVQLQRLQFSAGFEILYPVATTIGDLSGSTIGSLTRPIGSLTQYRTGIMLAGTAGVCRTLEWEYEDVDGTTQSNFQDWVNAVTGEQQISSSMRTGYSDLGAVTHWKTVQELTADLELGDDDQAQFGLRVIDHDIGTARTVADQALVEGVNVRYKLGFRESGRLFAINFNHQGDQRYSFAGGTLAFRMRGPR